MIKIAETRLKTMSELKICRLVHAVWSGSVTLLFTTRDSFDFSAFRRCVTSGPSVQDQAASVFSHSCRRSRRMDSTFWPWNESTVRWQTKACLVVWFLEEEKGRRVKRTEKFSSGMEQRSSLSCVFVSLTLGWVAACVKSKMATKNRKEVQYWITWLVQILPTEQTNQTSSLWTCQNLQRILSCVDQLETLLRQKPLN